jgi:hypothetical protein
MPQVLARSLRRWGRSARWSSAKTSIDLDRERMFPALGPPSSAEPAECVEVTVIVSFYVTALRLTAFVSPVTISSDEMFFHSMK